MCYRFYLCYDLVIWPVEIDTVGFKLKMGHYAFMDQVCDKYNF